MACKPCEERRKMIADARAQGGAKAVVRVLPRIARDILKNPPKLRYKRNG